MLDSFEDRPDFILIFQAQVLFDPANPSHLLSGSADGLVNLYDTSATDEDEALTEVLNYGASIHHAGYLNNETIFALSHDETFAVFAKAACASSDGPVGVDGSEESRQMQAFGDIRETLDCSYAINVLPVVATWSSTAGLAVGKHRFVRPKATGI